MIKFKKIIIVLQEFFFNLLYLKIKLLKYNTRKNI